MTKSFEIPKKLVWEAYQRVKSLRGWKNYYGRFYSSAMTAVWLHMNTYLMGWLMRKHKSLIRHKMRAKHVLGKLAAASR